MSETSSEDRGGPGAPSAGARYLLVRQSQDEQGGLACARYEATVTTADATYRAELLLREDGGVELAAGEGGAALPEALAKALGMFAKLTARGAPSRRAEGVPLWPARVTRWRP